VNAWLNMREARAYTHDGFGVGQIDFFVIYTEFSHAAFETLSFLHKGKQTRLVIFNQWTERGKSQSHHSDCRNKSLGETSDEDGSIDVQSSTDVLNFRQISVHL
jgi:hypothetical protein